LSVVLAHSVPAHAVRENAAPWAQVVATAVNLLSVFVRCPAAHVGIAMRDITVVTVSAGADTVTAKSICSLLKR
jgi:hypothetical protein